MKRRNFFKTIIKGTLGIACLPFAATIDCPVKKTEPLVDDMGGFLIPKHLTPSLHVKNGMIVGKVDRLQQSAKISYKLPEKDRIQLTDFMRGAIRG